MFAWDDIFANLSDTSLDHTGDDAVLSKGCTFGVIQFIVISLVTLHDDSSKVHKVLL